jgi:hypothetical protein
VLALNFYELVGCAEMDESWQKGSRTAILALIENYATIVISSETLKNWLEAIKK